MVLENLDRQKIFHENNDRIAKGCEIGVEAWQIVHRLQNSDNAFEQCQGCKERIGQLQLHFRSDISLVMIENGNRELVNSRVV